MSKELKATTVYDAYWKANSVGEGTGIQVYLKYEADKVIAELEEERRWRKFPDEKPSEEGYYIICGSSGFRNADKWTYCKDRQKMDFSFYSYGVKYWMPMPSAPKEENK
jgi:hypothetical protein